MSIGFFGVEIMVFLAVQCIIVSSVYFHLLQIMQCVMNDLARSGSRAIGNRLWSASSAKDARVEG